MNRDLTIEERDAKGLRGPRGCTCATCLREDLDTFVHVGARDMRAGDVVKSMVPVAGLDRCALGEILELHVAYGSTGSRIRPVVKWEDEDAPRMHARGARLLVEWKGWDDSLHLQGVRQDRA